MEKYARKREGKGMLRYEWKWDSCYRCKHDFLQYFCLFLYRHVWLW